MFNELLDFKFYNYNSSSQRLVHGKYKGTQSLR